MAEFTPQSAQDYSSAYYDPPAVPWWLLLSFFIFVGSISQFLPHAQIWAIVASLLGALWCVYICLWLRRLDARSKALYWILTSTGTGLLTGILDLKAGHEVSWLETAIDLASTLTYVVGIYVIRAELERHYNRRENFSLSLGPFMTFFFSFIYFQYHLYDIAESRKREREALRQPQ